MYAGKLLAVAGLLASTAQAAYQGFNYGATYTDQSPKQLSDFQAAFSAAKKLAGTNGRFSSARLYTMVQPDTGGVTSAIPAAINTGTHLLLGLWASGGAQSFASELAALRTALSQYGPKLAPLLAGISVGSEDLYRNSPTGIKNKSGIGENPLNLANYIKQVRAAIAGTYAAHIPIGHVDTWTAWVNGSNAAVAAACDFVGMDAYPYFQTEENNSIEQGKADFFSALQATKGATGKEVWITETGWPVSGAKANLAVPSALNAKKYWDDVGCQVLGNINTWWFTLQDADPTTPNPSFGLVKTLGSAPLFDLSCSNVQQKPITMPHKKPSPMGQHLKPHHQNQEGDATKPKNHLSEPLHAPSRPHSSNGFKNHNLPNLKVPQNTPAMSPTPTPTPIEPTPLPPSPTSGGSAPSSSFTGAAAPVAQMKGAGYGLLAVVAAMFAL